MRARVSFNQVSHHLEITSKALRLLSLNRCLLFDQKIKKSTLDKITLQQRFKFRSSIVKNSLNYVDVLKLKAINKGQKVLKQRFIILKTELGKRLPIYSLSVLPLIIQAPFNLLLNILHFADRSQVLNACLSLKLCHCQHCLDCTKIHRRNIHIILERCIQIPFNQSQSKALLPNHQLLLSIHQFQNRFGQSQHMLKVIQLSTSKHK